MENKFLNTAWVLSGELNYLNHNDLKEFELDGYEYAEEVRNSILKNGKDGLLYFIDQYKQFHELFDFINERIQNHVNIIRKMSYDPDHDDVFDVRLQNMLKFGEIWSDTWHRLNDIKKVFFPDTFEIKDKQEQKYKTFSDLLTEKYKSKEKEIVKLLGKCFPDHYNEDGVCYRPNKHNIKGILNTFMFELKKNNIFINDYISSENDKEVVCKIFADKFIPGGSIVPKTLFTEENGILYKSQFKGKITNLSKEIERIISIT